MQIHFLDHKVQEFILEVREVDAIDCPMVNPVRINALMETGRKLLSAINELSRDTGKSSATERTERLRRQSQVTCAISLLARKMSRHRRLRNSALSQRAPLGRAV